MLVNPEDGAIIRPLSRNCESEIGSIQKDKPMSKARGKSVSILFVAALIFSFPLASHAQNRERFVISARAGGVNAVSGRASMRTHGNSEWQQLTIKEDLEAGDVVKTGLDGRVEMLLNPGSYLRLGEDSEFELADNSLENLEVRLLRGTAIVEVTGADDEELFIGITTPHTHLSIVRRGLYRVNVVPGDTTELIVRKGRVVLEGSHTKVNGGNKVVFSGGSFSVAKLRHAEKKDGLESWSKARAQTLAKANSQISRETLITFASSFRNDWSYANGFSRPGFWLYSSGITCYTFIPYSADYTSPYGGGYRSLWASGGCSECRRVWLAPGYDSRGYAIPGYPSSVPTSTGSGMGPGQSGSSSRGSGVSETPTISGKPDISPGGPGIRPPIQQ